MIDTSFEIQQIFSQKIMRKSGVERLKLGTSMFEAAKKLALASFPDNISDKHRKIMLFKRIYGNDFTLEEINKICAEF